VDGLRAAEVQLTNVRVDRDRVLGAVDRGYPLLEAVAIDGILAVCAEAVGAMEVLYKDTVEYTQQRVQFDHPLSDFQVLQHRMVDMFVEYEQCKSLLYRATMEIASGAPGAARTVHALKHLVGKAAIFVGENAVQLHGGMGMTEELRIGHYFKRLLAIDMQFGNADHHLMKFAA
jgi:alkylation response protein AidB-like acyl-CoA dehydrogenase